MSFCRNPAVLPPKTASTLPRSMSEAELYKLLSKGASFRPLDSRDAEDLIGPFTSMSTSYGKLRYHHPNSSECENDGGFRATGMFRFTQEEREGKRNDIYHRWHQNRPYLKIRPRILYESIRPREVCRDNLDGFWNYDWSPEGRLERMRGLRERIANIQRSAEEKVLARDKNNLNARRRSRRLIDSFGITDDLI
ncbi:hypothetical protein FOZ60_004130 [Perkinsus olseni]|uniref:Uncharacterized protein n=1 Tax=Perkinsus olseni TaxID=32597 RepID=A0A7J6NUR9_PEROL|nr:hypothetical protein FOZ60_004130 [Perkinsus olseni]